MRTPRKFIKYNGSLYCRVKKAELTFSNPWRNAHQDTMDALSHAADFYDINPINEDLEPDDFNISYVWMPLDEVGGYDDISSWLDAEEGELAGASDEEILDWASDFRGSYFRDRVRDILTKGFPAIVVVDTIKYTGIGDGRGRFNLATALGLKKLPVILLTDKSVKKATTMVSSKRNAKRMLRYRGKLYRLASLAEAEMERLFKEILPSSPFSNHVFAVGGYVRDEIMGLNSKDLDVVIDVKGGAKNLAKYIHSLFPAETSTPRQLGKGYPIWFIAFKEDVEFEGKTYRTSGAEIDIAETQKEGFPDPDSRQRDVEFGTIDEDMQRRDFTVNQLMKDMTTGEILDLSGTGVKDIKNGILRTHPNVIPDTVFKDDPLRMMRLVRFMAKYGWKAAPEVVEAVKRNAHRIDIISGERLQGEMTKIMNLGKTAQAIRFMQETGLLKHILPEIEALRGVEQSKEHHSEGDVFEHTMKVLENAKPTLHAQLAALLHDTGKPATQKFIGDKIQFLGHEVVSGEITEAILRRLKFDLKTIKKVRFLVENHMRPTTAKEWSQKAVRKFIRDIGEEIEDLLDLHDADSAGSVTPEGVPAKNTGPILREKLKEVQKVPVRTTPILDGKTVMNLLGVSSGPEVGRALRWLQDKVDEYASEGKDITPEEASKLLTTEYKR